MKKRIQTNTFKIALIALVFTGATSCNETKKPEDTKEVAEEHNEAKFDNTAKEKDSQFLVDAAEISLEEIQLGRLAQQNTNMSDVNELGRMMEKEHGQSLADLTALAARKMMTVPTSITDDAKDAYDKLNKKSGSEFNNDYCDRMVKGHKNAIALFERASTESSDADIRDWALSTLPALRAHLDHAITCQKQCEKMK